MKPLWLLHRCVGSHLSNETYSPKKEELGNTSSPPCASVISIPELFTYALYIVIAFMLEVIYLAITLLIVLLRNKLLVHIVEPRIFRLCAC